MTKPFQITIDGPVASGKSTVARLLAEKLNWLYIDTGSMYRAVALESKNKSIDWHDQDKVEALAPKVNIFLARPRGKKRDGRSVTVLLNHQDVSWDIRTQDIAEGASVVSAHPGVRKVLVAKQQQMAGKQNVIMEGRDIGTRVLPNAQLKIFMTADVDKRVKWKQLQMKMQGQNHKLEDVRQALIKRDKREMNRKVDPLRPAKDAWILDTSNLTIKQIVNQISKKAKELQS